MSFLPLQGIFVALLGIIQLVQCANLTLYSPGDTSLQNYETVPLSNAVAIMSSKYYNKSQECVVYTFGYSAKKNGPVTTAVLRALISREIYNVILMDWEKEASPLISISNSTDPYTKQISYVLTGLKNAYIVGFELASALLNLVSNGLNLLKSYFVAHSLGAQLMGFTGRVTKAHGYPLGRIIGLDPAGPGYENPSLLPTLNADDAVNVLCVHSDPGDYGVNKTRCTVDLLPNYLAFTLPDAEDNIQPGCPRGQFTKFSENDLCSHNRSCMLFIEALELLATLIGGKADNVYDWNRGLGNCSDTFNFNLDWDTTKNGVYFMNTSSTYPYGLGMAGSCPSTASN